MMFPVVQQWEPVTLSKKRPAPQRKPHKPDEEEDDKVARVSQELRMAVQRARLAKEMTQRDLAKQINEKASVVNDYESGRAVPTPNIISKLQRALGVKLPRNNKKKGGEKP